MYKNLKYLFICSLFFVACSEDIEEDTSGVESEVPVTAGTANFSKYFALGNSLTAGYADGALFRAGQSNSYPKLLSDQFALAGGGDFKIPFMSDNLGGFSFGGNQVPQTGVRTYWNGCAPTPVSGISATVLGVSIAANGPYNNVGIPGAKCIDLVTSGYASLSPYFGRIATGLNQTVLEYATSQSPTFFSLWIGNNDVLGYALAGGDTNLAQITPSAGAVGIGFDSSYNAIVDGLTANGAKGVVGNIPFVTSIPNFTTVSLTPVAPYKYFTDTGEGAGCAVYPVSPNDVTTINTINASVLGPVKQILTAFGQGDRIQLLSTTNSNPILIIDETLSDLSLQITGAALASGNPQLIALAPFLGPTFGKARHTKVGDLIPLASSAAIATNAALPPGIPASLGVNGITYPLGDRFVLIPSEIEELRIATVAYNLTIKNAAEVKGLAFVDANAALNDVANGGVVFDNFHMTSDFVKGGAFGLDGVHPSARGQAYIANKFIEAINAKYGSTLRKYKAQDFPLSYPAGL
jgi:lysophospholipase L1-like esterase